MGAVDLVIQVESPGAVSRGMQRVGRAGHSVGEPSRGTLYPKHRGDLLEAAVVARANGHRPDRDHSVPAQPARCARPADRRSRCDASRVHGRVRGRACSPVRQLRRAQRRPVAQRARSACRAGIPATSSTSCGPRLVWDRTGGTLRARDGSKRLGGHQRRHHPRPRSVRRVPARRHPRRRARRGDGLREPSRRDVPARRQHVAHRGDHVRACHRHTGTRRAGQDAVLARRSPGTAARARRALGAFQREMRGLDGRCRDRAADGRVLPRPLRCRQRRHATSTSRRRPPAPCPTIARSSSSGSATRSATGGCASSPRSARRCTHRGQWRSSAG